MPEVHDSEVEETVRSSWLVRSLYIGLIAANLYLVADWWATTTPEGQAFVERWRERIEKAKARAAECEGCARRKAAMRRGFRAAANRMHWEAQQIVTGDDVDVEPDQ